MQLFSHKKVLQVLSDKALLPTSLCSIISSICLAFEFCEKHATCPINNGTIKSKYFNNVLLKFIKVQISLHVTNKYEVLNFIIRLFHLQFLQYKALKAIAFPAHKML